MRGHNVKSVLPALPDYTPIIIEKSAFIFDTKTRRFGGFFHSLTAFSTYPGKHLLFFPLDHSLLPYAYIYDKGIFMTLLHNARQRVL